MNSSSLSVFCSITVGLNRKLCPSRAAVTSPSSSACTQKATSLSVTWASGSVQ